ncbi:MAG TPA: hypothetical protein VNQ74_14900, partial [Burkholderiaceae bacterium]|nr:hypothetical protein [Burkholderiaceae bacterium]
GPDGALYVVDMYRAVIEHPYWMPDELRKRPDLLHGRDRGRIYRIVPQEFRRPQQRPLSQLSSAELVDFLGDPNVWLRETAARLLLDRNDAALGPQLIRLAHTGSQRARIHAIWLLQGLGLLREESLIQLLADQDPRIVEQAIIAAESRIPKSKEIKTPIAALATSPDARVRFHALLAATPLPTAPAFPADQWELDAMLIAAGNRGGDALAIMLKDTPALTANIREPQRFVAQLARLAAASPDRTQQVTAIEALLPSAEFRLVGLAAVLAEASRRGTTLSKLLSQLSESSRDQCELAIQHARADAFNSNLPESARCDAINLISFMEGTGKQLISHAVDDPSQAVRVTAIAALAKQSDAEQWRELCSDFV